MIKKAMCRYLISGILTFIFSFGIVSCNAPGKKTENSYLSDTTTGSIQKSDSSESDVVFDDFDSMVRQYEDPERKNWQSPELVLQKMGNLSGKTVADIGVGTGYFAFRIIQEGAHVIGVDIDKRFLDYIEERKAELSPEIASHLETRLTVPESPELNTNEVDWVLVVNTYHFLENRVDYLNKLNKAIKPGGKIMIIDFKKGYSPVGPPDSAKVLPDETMSELKSAGFQVIDNDETSLQYQYIIRARKP
jgi:ubiquinone/menaquinone biosynthesis C-methylase UbiE